MPVYHMPVRLNPQQRIRAEMPYRKEGDAESDAALLSFARRLLEMDKSRRKIMGSRHASFAQWYVILHLFIAHREQRSMSITDLIHGAGTPRSTILKAVADMTAAGFVNRIPDRRDRRRIYLMLDLELEKNVSHLLENIFT